VKFLNLLMVILVGIKPCMAIEATYSDLEDTKKYSIEHRPVIEDDVFSLEPTDLSVNFGTGASCGEINFHSNLKAALKNIATQLTDKKTLNKLAKAAPMLLACQYSPAFCKAIQNIEQSANFLMKFNLDRCALIDKHTDNKAAEYQRSKAKCIGEYKSQGLSQTEAIEKCTKTIGDRLVAITGSKEIVEKVDIINDSLTYIGLNDKSEKEDVKKVVGEVTMNHGVITEEYPTKDGTQNTPFQMVEEAKSELESDFCALVNDPKVLQKSSSLEIINKSKVHKKHKIYLVPSDVNNMITLPAALRKSFCEELAKSYAEKKVLNRIIKTRTYLIQSLENPRLSTYHKEVLNNKLNKLTIYQETLTSMNTSGPKEILKDIEKVSKELSQQATSEDLRSEKKRIEVDSTIDELTSECSLKGDC